MTEVLKLREGLSRKIVLDDLCDLSEKNNIAEGWD